MVMMMMMMQNEAAASSTCRALLGRRCPRKGEEKCLCCGIYLMCIMKGIEKQDLQLSCWSCAREGGPSVPCGHLFSGHHVPESSPVPPPCCAGGGRLGALGIAGTMAGTKGPEGRRLAGNLHKEEEEAALGSAHLPSSVAVPEAPLGWG